MALNTKFNKSFKSKVMKKIIILTIATLSTGIVLSSSLKRDEVVAKPASLEIPKSMQQKTINMHTIDVVAQAD